MAEHPLEVEEITDTADALLLNLGNISDSRMEAMKKSIVIANNKSIPVVLDVVGIACSKLRRNFAAELLRVNQVQVIKGNYSEIAALFDENYRSSGVDAAGDVTEEFLAEAIYSMSEKYKAIVVATGEKDLVGFQKNIYSVSGGTKQLSQITGTGCMLGALIATALAFDNSAVAVEKACSFFKKCGEKAETDKGGGTFMMNLMDALGGKNEF